MSGATHRNRDRIETETGAEAPVSVCRIVSCGASGPRDARATGHMFG
ncbi:hypothetical protein C7S16_0362 [Burkholderia thailandensis]|uniref:Uncharacterized protein n=1 Tax=Burkholderia thailandensis TaxID=57975 RepID=A0AAW9D675_BURTH|nr:hypothetical protein [Burkholderia thailandensis]MDW9257272.1 hypothetical protein [Burkholderia thailandensis]